MNCHLCCNIERNVTSGAGVVENMVNKVFFYKPKVNLSPVHIEGPFLSMVIYMSASYVKYFEKPFMCARQERALKMCSDATHFFFTEPLFEVFQPGSTLISSFHLTLA